ncbi:MAG: caspase family protein [Elusimicrobiota bacterium]|nr:caspase family protein [Elusimicrobiota bacterium]
MSKLALLAAVLVSAALCATGCATSNPAVRAIDKGDMTVLRSVLDSGYPLGKTVWNGNFNLLEYAACKGQDKAVIEILAGGADINKGHELSRKYGVYYSPLSRAIQCNSRRTNPTTVRLLLDRGAKVDPMSLAMVSDGYNDASITAMVREAAELQSQGINTARAVSSAPRPQPGNLDAAAYDRMRQTANLPAEKRPLVSDVDSPTRRGASRPDDFALVIGVEDYQSLPKADHGVRDAQTVRRHLEALGFPARNIISLEGSQATGNKLKSYLEEWLPLNVKPNSTLFVYYSGHGAPDPSTGDAYLVPWDGDATFLKSTAYPLKKFYADLSKTKAKRIIVALDACFSGAGGRSVLAQGARPLVAKVAEVSGGDRVTVLAAASGEEITGSLNEQGHGMFTYFLLKGLAEGKRTARELHEYLLPRVQDEARRQNRQQTPALIGQDAPL